MECVKGLLWLPSGSFSFVLHLSRHLVLTFQRFLNGPRFRSLSGLWLSSLGMAGPHAQVNVPVKTLPISEFITTQMSGVFLAFPLGPGSRHPSAHMSLQLETRKRDETCMASVKIACVWTTCERHSSALAFFLVIGE